MASSVIPQDIIDSIIAAVDDHRLLKTCALVSSSFLLPSRKSLFSSISLRTDQACQRLYQFLVENPVVRSFVRCISLSWSWHLGCRSSSLVSILRLSFCCLKSFVMWESNWNDFSSELKDVLSTTVHSSTLQTLVLFGVVNMPIALLHGVHLKNLTLSSISPLDLGGEQSRSALAASDGVANTASHTVIDHCEWGFHHPMPRILPEGILLAFMCHLRVFEIYVSPSSAKIRDLDILSFVIRSLRVSLSSPATLEHLKIHIIFQSHSNRFDCDAFFEDLRAADVWKHLDSFITHPSSSRLRRVDIHITYTFRYNHSDDDVIDPEATEVVQPILDALPLLREKGILFVKATHR